MPKKLPIGIDDFPELVNTHNNYLYVDKSLMIAAVIDDGDKVTLITRPRRWGKSLNFSMLQHFFAREVGGNPTAGLFNGLKIASHEGGKYMAEQGQYPVLLITFKEVKLKTFAKAMEEIKQLVAGLYEEHQYLLESDKLSGAQKRKIRKFIDEEVNQIDLQNSLKLLSRYLSQHTGKQVYIFIDEYDAPAMCAHQYDREDYLNDMTLFMRNFLSAGLKGNPALKKGLMTGILRISYNEMLSGLGIIRAQSFLEDRLYAPFYGFSEEEVQALFIEQQLPLQLEAARTMYNGYQIKGITLYNPWSVNSCLAAEGQLLSYWLYTGDHSLMKEYALAGGVDIKNKFTELLIQGKTIEAMISPHLRFETLHPGGDGIWTLLLYAGYLKTVEVVADGTRYRCQLTIPNQEVFYVYRDIFIEWFQNIYGEITYEALLSCAVAGDINQFIQQLNIFMLSSVSQKDFTQEGHYHTFVLGLFSGLRKTHRIESNPEAGHGFLDVVVVPQNSKQSLALILEFKHIHLSSYEEQMAMGSQRKAAHEFTEEQRLERLRIRAKEGFLQIDARNYAAILLKYPHVQALKKVSIAFLGKMAGAYYQHVDRATGQASELQEIFPTLADALSLTREEAHSSRSNKRLRIAATTETAVLSSNIHTSSAPRGFFTASAPSSSRRNLRSSVSSHTSATVSSSSSTSAPSNILNNSGGKQ